MAGKHEHRLSPAKSLDDNLPCRSNSKTSISRNPGHSSQSSDVDTPPASVEATQPFHASLSTAPYHVFSKRKRAWIIFLVTVSATFSPLSSNIYFPALNEIADDLNIANYVVNLSITTYMIAQGITPSFWGPLADVYGRRIVLICTLILYIGANVGLAFAQDAPMLLIFRFIQAAGSSSTISLGAGVICDLAEPSERGGYLGYFSGGRQFSMAIGPVIGGLLGGTLGFRSIFWFLVILSTAATVLLILCLPETLRRLAGDGSIPLTHWTQRPLLDILRSRHHASSKDEEKATDPPPDQPSRSQRRIKAADFYSPLRLIVEKDVVCTLLYGACIYTSWSMITASTTSILQSQYGLSTVLVGVCFLANGLGCFAGSIISGRALNETFHKEAGLWQLNQDLPKTTPMPKDPIPTEFPLEHARLSHAPLHTAVCIFASLVYGWSQQPLYGASHVSVSLVVPLLALFAVRYSATAVLNSNNTLVVDLFPGRSSSATALNNLARCSLGAVGVALVDYVTDSIGSGWLSVILAGIAVLGFSTVTVQTVYGKRWRARRARKVQLQQIRRVGKE